MIDEDRLADFLISENREKYLAVFDRAFQQLANMGVRVSIASLVEMIPWYTRHSESVDEAARQVVDLYGNRDSPPLYGGN